MGWKLVIRKYKADREWHIQLTHVALGIVPAEWVVHSWNEVNEQAPRLWGLVGEMRTK